MAWQKKEKKHSWTQEGISLGAKNREETEKLSGEPELSNYDVFCQSQ